MKEQLPGTLWVNRGRWNWRVRLPNETQRRNIVLRQKGHSVGLAEAKGRDIAESLAWRIWEGSTRRQRRDPGDSLDEVCGRFLGWAGEYYTTRDGRCGELAACEVSLRRLRARYGTKPINDICYSNILEVRDEMAQSGIQRGTVNKYVGVWKRMFAWALENRLCDAATKVDVWAISSLKRTRSNAPEGAPVMPVHHREVKAVMPFMPKTLSDMVKVEELCGARPGEMCDMRPEDIVRKREVWIYRPYRHKMEHLGKVRIIVLGPRAQAILKPYMRRARGKAIFSPKEATKERLAAMRAARKTKVQPSQVDRSKVGKKLEIGEAYNTASYNKAVLYACRAAKRAGVDVYWSPNQLRHACGTRVRRKFGPDAARVVLGHSDDSRRITDRYTREAIEVEIIRAASRVMQRIG